MSRRRPDKPRVVIAADTGHAVILLDARTGQVTALAGTARSRWLARPGRPAPVPVREAAASWGTSESPAALPEIAVPSATWAARAVAALIIALSVRSAGPRGRAFARMAWLARIAAGSQRAAAPHEAGAAVHAVRWAARFTPARVACLEESAAAMVALALAGRRADWRHGIAADPVRLHAWIEAAGQPVGEPASVSAYAPLIRVPLPGEQEAPHV